MNIEGVEANERANEKDQADRQITKQNLNSSNL